MLTVVHPWIVRRRYEEDRRKERSKADIENVDDILRSGDHLRCRCSVKYSEVAVLKCCLVIRFHFFLLSFLHVGFRSIWVEDWTSFLVTRNFYSLLNLRLHDARLK